MGVFIEIRNFYKPDTAKENDIQLDGVGASVVNHLLLYKTRINRTVSKLDLI